MTDSPRALNRLHRHRTAVHLHHAPDQAEPEAGALEFAGIGSIHLVELLEDTGLVFLRKTDAGIDYLNHQVVSLQSGQDTDGSAIGGELHPVRLRS